VACESPFHTKGCVTILPELQNILASCLTKQRLNLKNMKNVSFFLLLSTEEKSSVSDSDPGLHPDSNGSVNPDPGRPKLSPIQEKIKKLQFEEFSVGLEPSPGVCPS
jgi:hypothetical protein